jgi:hypothetical protein
MLQVLAHLAARFKEPSSWAGLAGLAALVGVHLDPSFAQSIAYIGAGVAGVVAFAVPERASAPEKK